MGPANLPDRAATSGKANEDRLDNLDVQEESAAVRCRVAATLARDGGEPRALWLLTIDRAIAAGRLEGERETYLPVVHRGNTVWNRCRLCTWLTGIVFTPE